MNFKRNEQNQNENSNICLSTKQLNKKLEIPEYKLILPDSWAKYNVARVIVYVKDDIKVKVKHLAEENDHIQSIQLEILIICLIHGEMLLTQIVILSLWVT